LSVPRSLGLALSGGGARGLVHIGVLKALEAANIPVGFLAGTSMGGVIAAAYAAGMSPADMEHLALEHANLRSLWRVADPTLPRKGLFKGEQLEAFFKKYLGEKTFEDLRIPLTLVAVDLNSGREIHLNQGCLAPAMRATLSIPGLLAPVEMDDMRLVDGGLLNNLPADVVRDMGADVVIGVDVYSDNTGSFWQHLSQKRLIASTIGDLIATLGDALNLVVRAHSAYRLQHNPPDFLLQPPVPPHVTVISGYDQAPQLIALGEQAVQEILPALRAALEETPPIHEHTPNQSNA